MYMYIHIYLYIYVSIYLYIHIFAYIYRRQSTLSRNSCTYIEARLHCNIFCTRSTRAVPLSISWHVYC